MIPGNRTAKRGPFQLQELAGTFPDAGIDPFKQIKIKTKAGKNRRTVLIFFRRPDLYPEVRLYFIYLRPEIRQHPAFMEEARAGPQRGFRACCKKPGLLKGILRKMNQCFCVFIQGSACRGEFYTVVGPDKQLKTAEIFEQIHLLDHSGRGYIQGFSGFAKGTKVGCFNISIRLVIIHGRLPALSSNLAP